MTPEAEGPPNPFDAYTPFSQAEIKRLGRYVARVHDLEQTVFIRDVKTIGWQMTMGAGEPMTATILGVDDKMLKETLMELRPLGLKKGSAGFYQVQALVKRHAKTKDSEAGRDAITQVKNHTRLLNEILDNPAESPIHETKVDTAGNVVAQWADVKAGSIFEDFINAIYFHDDEDRLERVEDWLPTELQRYAFISVVHAVSHVYRSFAIIVEGILGEPAMRA